MAVEARCSGLAALRLGGRVPGHVVGDEEVQPAIVVVVEPAGGDRPQFAQFGIDAGQPGLGGDILENVPLPRLR